jgi:hypothetical protein
MHTLPLSMDRGGEPSNSGDCFCPHASNRIAKITGRFMTFFLSAHILRALLIEDLMVLTMGHLKNLAPQASQYVRVSVRLWTDHNERKIL